jgi:hypothetical protein
MEINKTALERAFELARSGKCLSVHDIFLHLHSEGYAVGQLEGSTLKKQLSALIEKATE